MKLKHKFLIDKKIYNIIIITLIITFSCFSFLSIKSFTNKQVEEIKTTKQNKEMYSVMVNNGDGVYKRYETDGSLYPSGFEYNPNKSYCEDLNGEKVTGVLKDNGSSFSVTSDITVYCYLYFDIWSIPIKSNGQPAASFMVANQSKIEGLWSSGLEGDGLRYVGTGYKCSYENGDYVTTSGPTCPKLYNYTRTTISSGVTKNYTYQTSCPSNTSTYTYSCTTLNGVLSTGSAPNNYICFGTTSASECKANEDKYMYRIIGVFPDEEGNQHLKLRKFKQLGTKKWNDTSADVNWGESTLYTELNGSYFLGNTTYSYLQDDSWSNKIENWKWTAVNTLTYSNSGPNYNSGSTMTPANIYLHEMNRSTKISTVGEWTYPTGKIGLIYASDYVLSLGDEALAITGSTSSNKDKLKTGWLHCTNNLISSSSAYDLTLARYGAYSSFFYAWSVADSGFVDGYSASSLRGVAPVFYLTPETTISGGMGTYSEPYIIG